MTEQESESTPDAEVPPVAVSDLDLSAAIEAIVMVVDARVSM